jgi:hypothetical protein
MLSPREAATLMAALLFWQEEMCPHDPAVMRPYFETLGLHDVEPLSLTEITQLSQRLRNLLDASGEGKHGHENA